MSDFEDYIMYIMHQSNGQQTDLEHFPLLVLPHLCASHHKYVFRRLDDAGRVDQDLTSSGLNTVF
jgi:hypothetical protein